LAQALLFGSLAKSNDVGEPLEEMSQIWKVFDEFEFDEDTSWHYYFDNKEIESSDASVKISYYKNKNKYLLLCVNSINKAVETQMFFSTGEWKIISQVNVDDSSFKDNVMKCKFDGFGYKIVLIEKNEL